MIINSKVFLPLSMLFVIQMPSSQADSEAKKNLKNSVEL